MRTLLILVDGMRSDAITDIKKAQSIIKKSTYTMRAKTVMPSVTLPCHMSLFHSVDPSRHGTTTNTYAPQVRPVKGLCEVLFENEKKNAFFYDWEELRDLSRPCSLAHSFFLGGRTHGYDKTNRLITDAAIEYLSANYTDFAFLYFGYPDEAGHQHGWMSDEYMKAIDISWENIERIVNSLPDDYTVIITADHGGHDRVHGTDLPEDMTIPLIIMGDGFEAGKEIENADIKDIAPTVAELLNVPPHKDWEGKSLK